MKYSIKKLISSVLLCTTILNMFSININAEEKKISDINLISPTEITVDIAKKWAKSKNGSDTFISLADIYWGATQEHGGINPALAYVQAGLETGFGKFSGVLDESYYNPCGMKNSTGGEDLDANAHYRFNNWEEGVKAHLDHLALYAGAESYPRTNTYDPRHFPFLLNSAPTVQSLSGKWATDKEYGNKIINNYNELLSIKGNEPKMSVDLPMINSSVDKYVNIRGWALNNSGIQKINAYINNIFVKEINMGVERLDVLNAYPSYHNAKNSGFEDVVEIGNYPEGNNILKIEVLGNDGSKQVQSININKENKISRMSIDSPISNTNISSELNIRGWALDNSGIESVKAYIDNKYVKELKIGINRPDVNDIYPGYLEGINSGFEDIIDMNNYTDGEYTLTIKVMGNSGIEQTQSIRFKKEKKISMLNIDLPLTDSKFGNQIKIRGWALNSSGVKEIKLYVDGKFVDEIQYGIERTDVDKAYPGYKNGKDSGFEGYINMEKYKGKHTIRIEAIGNDNTIQAKQINVYSGKKQSLLRVDLPKLESSYNDSVVIRGWSLDDSGVKEVNAYIDGKYIKTLNKNISRPDVDNAYPGYINGKNSGFDDSIDVRGYSNGRHTLRIDSIGNDGDKKSNEVVFSIGKKQSIMSIDSPVSNSRFTSELNIRGWGLNDSGVKEVKAYIDGKYVKTIKNGLNRSDVNSVYPGYTDGVNSGFEDKIDMTLYKNGDHILKIEVIGYDDTYQTQEVKILAQKKPSKISVDSPIHNTKFNKELKIRGWALDDSGIKEVRTYINGKYIKNINTGINRPDVNNVYPEYAESLKSGFEGIINMEGYNNNSYILKVEIISKDGSAISQEVNIKSNLIDVIDVGLEFDFGVQGPSLNKPQKLVLHHAAGNSTVQSVHNYHRFTNGWAGIGYHFYIHKDGKIYKGREENWRGAHAAEVPTSPNYGDGILENDVNATSLGISVQGDYMTQSMPKAQEDAVVRVGQYAVEKYGMSEVFKHGDTGIGQTSCPGRNYPFERIKAKILSKSVYGIDTDNLDKITN